MMGGLAGRDPAPKHSALTPLLLPAGSVCSAPSRQEGKGPGQHSALAGTVLDEFQSSDFISEVTEVLQLSC